LHSEFLAYIYQSYKAIKTVFNTGNLVSAEAMNDFITEYQTRLALSHQMSEIEFPGQTFDTAKINAQLRQLEDSIAAINNDIFAAIETAGSPLTADQLFQTLGKDRVDAFNKLNTAIINGVTKEIVLQQKKMIQILQGEARHLGLVDIAK